MKVFVGTGLRTAGGLATLLALGCFSPEASINEETDGGSASSTTAGSGTSGGADSTGADPTTTTTTTPTTTTTASTSVGPDTGDSGSSTGPEGSPPEILSFTANGQPKAFQGDFAQGVDLELEANDRDGEIVRMELFVDDDSLAAQDGPGPGFAAEWLISGAVMNGAYQLVAEVEDNDGNVTQQVIGATLDMPNGGFTDVWEDEGGFSYAVATDAEGESVVGVGIEQPLIDEGEPGAQVLRVNGSWATSQIGSADWIGDTVVAPDGDVWAVASIPASNNSTDSALLRFTAAGNFVDSFGIDAGQETPADGPDYPISLSQLSGGDFIISGVYAPADGSPLATYVLRASPTGEVVWLERTGEMAGAPFVYEAAVGADNEVHVGGTRIVGGQPQAWYGTISPNGDFLSQNTIADFFESHAYASAAAPDGRFALAGTQRESTSGSWSRWLRVYGDSGELLWSRESTADRSFGHALAFDDFGNVITASTENCELDLEDFAYGRCSLRVQKYDGEGELVWMAAGLGGAEEFNGPVILAPGIQADVTTDRYGYVYASGLHRVPSPVRGDWWVARINP